MTIHRRAVLAATLATPGIALAQSFPTRPVRLVVPFAAGGPTDAIARLVAQQLETAWGQSVVVENRPGAGGSTGSAVVARAAPDGQVLLVTANSHAINPSVLRNLPFDTLRDFTAICRLADAPFLLVAHPSLGARTLPEFIAAVRAKPGQLNYSSAGHGTGNHLTMERLKQLAGLDITHIPFGGAAPATTALLSGQVQALVNNLVNSLPHIAEGKMVPIAIGSPDRQAVLPDVAPFTETYPGFLSMNWYAAFGPAGMAPALVQQINAAMARAVRTPSVADRLRAQGISPAGGPAEAFGHEVAEEVAEWARVTRAAGIQPE
jgi:tripartite-type tricarboxylate transporter receptor subunit TctC